MAASKHRRDCWESVLEKAYEAQSNKHYKEAELIYRVALNEAAISGIKTAELGRLYVMISEMYVEQADYARAAAAIKKAVLSYEGASSNYNVDMAAALKLMSEISRVQGLTLQSSILGSHADLLSDKCRQRLEDCYNLPSGPDSPRGSVHSIKKAISMISTLLIRKIGEFINYKIEKDGGRFQAPSPEKVE